MEIGIDSFVAAFANGGLAESPVQRMHHFVEQIVLADQVGLDAYGIGEHHRKEFLDSATPVIPGAAGSVAP